MKDRQRQQLAQALGAASRRLAAQQQDEQDIEAVTGVITAAVVTVPGAAYAGVGLIDRSATTLTTLTGTHPLTRQCDQWHTDLGHGPCLSAIHEQYPVLITDTAEETPWPGFTDRAAAHGLTSMLAYPLCLRRRSVGVMSLYATRDKHFDLQAQILGELFATHATVALYGAVPKRQLDPALATRDLIGQAKGILMHREDITGMDAFTLLLHTSRETHISLADVAGWLVDEHEHPEQATYLVR